MLQTIRDNTRGVIAGILIGFLVIIFALSGAEALFSGSSRSGEVASVGGETITENQVVREIHRQRQQILNQYGDSVPSEFVSDERLREPAINSLIQRQIMVQSARAQGMAVSDEMLDSIIVDIPQFAGETGRFDPQRYQQVLRQMGYTPAQYKTVLGEEILLNHLTLGIGASGFVTDDELSRFVSLNFQTRDFQYLTLSESSVADEVSVSDEAVEEYYQNNQQQFRQEEQVAVDYIELSVDQLIEDIDIDEQTLRRQYEENMAAEQTGGERRVAHILLEDADSERAAELLQRIEDGEDFADLAREYSDDFGSSDQGGDLGFTSGEGLPDEFVAAMNALEVGEISEPVSTEAGLHLIKVLEGEGGEQPTFEEQRDRIARQLARIEAENDFVSLMERLADRSYNADRLGPVADEMGLPLGNTGLFTRSGGEGMASEQAVVEAAFSEEVLERGNSSEMIELSADRMVVIKKTDRQSAYTRPLEEVRDEIIAHLEQQQTRDLLAERGETVREALEAGQSIADVAEEFGLELSSASGVERNDSSVDRRLLQHVFALPRPGDSPRVSSAQTSEGYAVIQLTQVEDGSIDGLSSEQRASLRRNLSNMLGERDYSAFRQQLRSEARVDR